MTNSGKRLGLGGISGLGSSLRRDTVFGMRHDGEACQDAPSGYYQPAHGQTATHDYNTVPLCASQYGYSQPDAELQPTRTHGDRERTAVRTGIVKTVARQQKFVCGSQLLRRYRKHCPLGADRMRAFMNAHSTMQYGAPMEAARALLRC